MIRIGSFFLCFLFSFLALSEVKNYVDRNKIYENESVRMTISVDVSDKEVEFPSQFQFKNFRILSRSSSQQMSMSFIQGKMIRKKTKTLDLSLQPKSTGQLTIESIKIKVGSHNTFTKALKIVVLKGKNPHSQRTQRRGGTFFSPPPLGRFLRSRPFDNLDQMISKSPPELVFEVDQTKAYVGQRILGRLILYSSTPVRSTQFGQIPNLKEFWRQDLEIFNLSRTETVIRKGERKFKTALTSMALFPLRSGNFTIGSFEAVVSFSSFFDSKSLRLSSQKKRVQIKEVPKGTQPENFSQLVGELELKAELGQKEVTQNKPFLFHLTIEGVGALHTFSLPPLVWPKEIQVYDIKSVSDISRKGVSRKVFKIYLVSKNSKTLKIPPLTLVVFNPYQNLYEELRTKEVEVYVKKNMDQKNTPSVSSFVEEGENKKNSRYVFKLDSKNMKVFSLKELLVIYSVTFLLAFVLGLGFMRMKRQKQENLLEVFKGKLLQAQKQLEKERRKGALKVLRLIEESVNHLAQNRSFSTSFRHRLTLDQRISMCSLKIQKILSPELEKINEKWEALAFAPEDSVLENQSSKEDLVQLAHQTWAVLEKSFEVKREEINYGA